ncbi:MAG: 3-deoxy-D-manno-octulosonic acid transferase [Nitrospiria bacterium]
MSRPAHRHGMAQRFGWYPKDFFQSLSGRQVFWIHASSVGEVLMSRSLVGSIKERYPKARIIYSTVTSTGKSAVLHQIKDIDLCIYLPLDLFWPVRSLVRKIGPDCFIFLETEIWPNLLLALSARGCPSLMMNGRISATSFPKYRMLRPFLSVVLKEVRLFLMQTKRDVERIVDLGAPPERVFCTGNMKYDEAASSMESGTGSGPNGPITRSHLGLSDMARVMIAGSTRSGEEEAVLHAYRILRSSLSNLVLVLAPRHLQRLETIEQLVTEEGLLPVRRQCIKTPSILPSDTEGVVILLDTLGELSRIYPIGELIFVGGSLVPKGGHNVLEPASHRKPVFFGPSVSNFHEIADQLIRSGGGIQVTDGEEMGKQMQWLSEHPKAYRKAGESAYLVVMNNRGAVQRNMERLSALLEKEENEAEAPLYEEGGAS